VIAAVVAAWPCVRRVAVLERVGLDLLDQFKVQRRDVRGQTIRLVITVPALYGPEYANLDMAVEPEGQGGSRVSIRASGLYGGKMWVRQIMPAVTACTTEATR
jgi:hypothetical protein